MLFAHPLSLANWAPTSPTQPQGQLPQSLTWGIQFLSLQFPWLLNFHRPRSVWQRPGCLYKKSIAAEAIMLNAGGVSGSRGWEEGAGGVSGGRGWRVGAGGVSRCRGWGVGAGGVSRCRGGGRVLGVWVGVGGGFWGCEWGQGVGLRAGGVSGGRGWGWRFVLPQEECDPEIHLLWC